MFFFKRSNFFSGLFSDYVGEVFHKKSWAFWEKTLTFIDRCCQYSVGIVVYSIKKIVLRNKKHFYKNFNSSDHPVLVFLSNLARPKRFLKKTLYGQVVKLPSALCLAKPYQEKDIDPRAYELAKKLKQDGVIELPDRYTQFADYLIQEYLLKIKGINIETIEVGDSKKVGFNVNDITQPILEFMVDPLVLSTFALYLGYTPYLLSPSDISIVYPSNSFRSTREINPIQEGLSEQGWHFDTVNQIQCTILLNDISLEDSHMEIAKKAHKRHRMNVSSKDYLYSEEYISDRYEIFHCCGKKGTVYLFDPNAPHRLHFTKNSMRVKFRTMYGPGNDSRALREPKGNNWISLEGLDCSGFNRMQKEALFFLQKKNVLKRVQ